MGIKPISLSEGKRGGVVVLVFKNLLINNNSGRFQPFLVNLLSGRRRLLNDREAAIVRSIANKERMILFNEDETEVFNQLISERQFLTEERRRYERLGDKIMATRYGIEIISRLAL